MDQILDALLLACFLLCGIYALGTGFALRRQPARGLPESGRVPALHSAQALSPGCPVLFDGGVLPVGSLPPQLSPVDGRGNQRPEPGGSGVVSPGHSPVERPVLVTIAYGQ